MNALSCWFKHLSWSKFDTNSKLISNSILFRFLNSISRPNMELSYLSDFCSKNGESYSPLFVKTRICMICKKPPVGRPLGATRGVVRAGNKKFLPALTHVAILRCDKFHSANFLLQKMEEKQYTKTSVVFSSLFFSVCAARVWLSFNISWEVCVPFWGKQESWSGAQWFVFSRPLRKGPVFLVYFTIFWG